MGDRNEIISQFTDVTGSNEDRAKFYLEAAQWQLEVALASFYEEDDGMKIDNESSENEASAADVQPEVRTASAPSSSKPLSQSSKNTSKAKPHSTGSGRIRTIASLNQGNGGSSDEGEGQAFYAGGSDSSGQQILGPGKKKKDIVADMFKSVQEHGAEVVDPSEGGHDSRPSSSFQGTGYRLGQSSDDSQVVSGSGQRKAQPVNVVLKLWREGFSVDDGALRKYSDPENKEFLESIRRGEIPSELVREVRNEIQLQMEDHRHEDPPAMKPKVKAFTGKGNTLGSPTPGAVPATAPALDDTAKKTLEEAARKAVEVDPAQPQTSIQVRLVDGSVLLARLNHTHTIADLRRFITTARPQYENATFTLLMTFPRKELTDDTETVEKAGILNAAVLQRVALYYISDSFATGRHDIRNISNQNEVLEAPTIITSTDGDRLLGSGGCSGKTAEDGAVCLVVGQKKETENATIEETEAYNTHYVNTEFLGEVNKTLNEELSLPKSSLRNQHYSELSLPLSAPDPSKYVQQNSTHSAIPLKEGDILRLIKNVSFIAENCLPAEVYFPDTFSEAATDGSSTDEFLILPQCQGISPVRVRVHRGDSAVMGKSLDDMNRDTFLKEGHQGSEGNSNDNTISEVCSRCNWIGICLRSLESPSNSKINTEKKIRAFFPKEKPNSSNVACQWPPEDTNNERKFKDVGTICYISARRVIASERISQSQTSSTHTGTLTRKAFLNNSNVVSESTYSEFFNFNQQSTPLNKTEGYIGGPKYWNSPDDHSFSYIEMEVSCLDYTTLCSFCVAVDGSFYKNAQSSVFRSDRVFRCRENENSQTVAELQPLVTSPSEEIHAEGLHVTVLDSKTKFPIQCRETFRKV